MDNIRTTVDLFDTGLTCSQAVLTVFGEHYGLDSRMALIVGRPLGGGMGHMGRTCGAVSAAVIVLGLAKDDSEEKEAREVTFAAVQELFRRFQAVHGTTDYKDLLGEDMSTEEGIKRIREQGLVRKVCPAFVRDAAVILQELLTPSAR
jgi:C_GCAxxG_C_C family probable redox protein